MNIFITICSCIVASIMTTLYCWKKFGKEEEERILQEQKERREKIRDSMLQTGSKRYPFPIDLKKASDWPYDRYHSSLCKHTGFIFYDIRTLIGCLFMLNIDDVSDYLSPWLLYLSFIMFLILMRKAQSESLLIGKTVDGLKGCSVRTGNALAIDEEEKV